MDAHQMVDGTKYRYRVSWLSEEMRAIPPMRHSAWTPFKPMVVLKGDYPGIPPGEHEVSFWEEGGRVLARKIRINGLGLPTPTKAAKLPAGNYRVRVQLECPNCRSYGADSSCPVCSGKVQYETRVTVPASNIERVS